MTMTKGDYFIILKKVFRNQTIKIFDISQISHHYRLLSCLSLFLPMTPFDFSIVFNHN